MINPTLIVAFSILFSSASFSQIYSGTGGTISDNFDTAYFYISVSGLIPPIIDSAFGLEEICLNISSESKSVNQKIIIQK